MTLWIDVGDLFDYIRAQARPSGIQRVALEIGMALDQISNQVGGVRFVRHSADARSYVTVPWPEMAAIYERLTAAPEGSTARLVSASGPEAAPGRARRMALALPTAVRVPLGKLLRDQARALGDLGALGRGVADTVTQVLSERRQNASEKTRLKAGQGSDAAGSENVFAPMPGDALVVFGAPWSHPRHADLLRKCRQEYGMRTGLLIHDLIPLLCPEWCSDGLPRIFRRWYEAVLPECDVIFAISDATRADVEAHSRESGIALRAPVQRVAMGSFFNLPDAGGKAPAPVISGSYVLIVGTIEARKNHALAFRVWRRLLAVLPAAHVPKLVFAGAPGWLADDLMRQIRNCDFLNGHLVLVDSPSDRDIDALYRGADFTLFPSYYEGWGLPVTESHSRGTPCLISNRSSLPEAGGGLAESFDPDNVTEAYEKVLNLITNPQALEAARQRVREGFTPVSWSLAAEQVVSAFR